MQQYVLQCVQRRHRLKLQLGLSKKSSEQIASSKSATRLSSLCAFLPGSTLDDTLDENSHVPSFSLAGLNLRMLNTFT